MRRLALPVLACLCLLAAGCGKWREPAPHPFTVKSPKGERTEEFLRAGMTIVRPRNWNINRRSAPGVFELVSGEATVAGWAYQRAEDLPETPEQLDAAKGRLVDAVEERDPDFELESAEVTEVAGSPAIEVEGEQSIAKRRLHTRSVHVFKGDVEYVIDALAPPRDGELVDGQVLEPLLGSIELEGEIREGAQE